MPLKLLDPETDPRWDEFVESHPEACFFHTSAWARVLSESYGYKPLYFTDSEDNRLKSLIPVMEVNSFITGKRGVSLPFTDFCPPLIAETADFSAMFSQIVEHGKKRGWKYIELRGGDKFLSDEPNSSFYYTHELDIAKEEDSLLSSFRNSTRRNIKKATKQAVEVHISHTLESIRQFYSLNCQTRKRHGLPPQPFRFFKKLHEHVISQNKGFLCLATLDGLPVAGVIFLHYGKKAIYKYGASDLKYQHLRANNLVMWEAIKECVRLGCETLNLGRTEPANHGLLQFKRGWAATEGVLKYFRYDLRKQRFVKHPGTPRESYRLLKRIPVWMLNLTGSLLYRHVG